MGWKRWPYWLKGGVIGIIFLLITIILLNLFLNQLFSFSYGRFILEVLSYSSLGALIGSFIGFLYGKIKNRNQAKR